MDWEHRLSIYQIVETGKCFFQNHYTTIKTTFMKHTYYLRAIIAIIALFSVNNAVAQKAHGPITGVDQGQTIRVCYDISGLGNVSNVDIRLAYTATVFGE